MGVGGSIKIMNYKFFSMKLFTFLKKVAPVMVIFVVVLGVLNFGSYDPYNELTVLTPNSVSAEAALAVPVLTVPTLSTAPTLTVPTISTPILTVPEVVVPVLETPVLSVPEITTPILEVPTLTVPTLSNVPGLTIPSLTIPTLTLPTLTTSSSTYTQSVQTCYVTASSPTVTNGSSVTITWSTQGFATLTVNGEAQANLNGSKTFTNVQANTTYTLVAKSADGKSDCTSTVRVVCVPPVVTDKCVLSLDKTVEPKSAKPGDELTYTIHIKNIGTANCTGGGVRIVDIHDENVTYLSETHTENINAGYGSNPVYTAGTRTLFFNGNTLTPGEEGTITWKGKVKDTFACDTNTLVKNTAKATAKELNNFNDWVYSNTVETNVTKTCSVPVASCDVFGVTPATITKGQTATLNWATTNATRVTINNGIGEVAASGTVSVAPLATIEYLLTAYGVSDQKHTCGVVVTVKDIPVETLPKCESFTATPTSLPVGGGNVVLNWTTTNASAVSISPTIGSVALNGSTTIALGTSTTFTLTATDVKGSTNSCVVAVPVTPPTTAPISCANNVTLSADAATIYRGNSSTLSWTTTGITGVRFDNGITATGLSGSTAVSPSDTTTYTLTATDGKDTISCPVTVSVRTSGGGGGSSSPRCELSVSDNKISSGDKVVLTWDSSRATDLFLNDKTSSVTLVTTENLKTSAKDRLMDGTITVSPKKDTTYELTVKRGSSKRTCTVKVDVEDNIVVTQVRDQQPLVAGISLSQVPYTGFEAGPILTLLFYTLLMAWALYIAYLIVIRRDTLGGLNFAANNSAATRQTPEQIRPDVFVAKVQAPAMPVSTLTPNNLPTGTPVVGYATAAAKAAGVEVSSNVHNIDGAEMTKIENHAHAQRVLLSSDAIRHFIATTDNQEERTEALDQVIVAAKAQFPAEDGWVVINEKRMNDLCLVCAANSVRSSAAPYIPAVIPEGAGSLAEAIVSGNVLAAYEMIGNRPMFALADAAADLDAVYRIRLGGEKAVASELLMKETATLTDEQILQMIQALTSALDGTYTDEASAVKMSIMKAIKVVA
jgi:uncharacterized repeat protein (TIGR01451 family)